MTFKQVVPEVLSGCKISIPHPDPCWVIRNPEDTASWSRGKSLFVFSDEEKAGTFFMKISPQENYQLKQYAWDELVEKFGSDYSEVIVDHKGEPCFYSIVPLQKGI